MSNSEQDQVEVRVAGSEEVCARALISEKLFHAAEKGEVDDVAVLLKLKVWT